VPTAENTNVPFKLLLLKPPLGGGVPVVVLVPPLPQLASKTSAEKIMGKMKRWRGDITSPYERFGP
jgi:hypothetical protein